MSKNRYFDTVLSWLDRVCFIKAPKDWLQACIEWIESENDVCVLFSFFNISSHHPHISPELVLAAYNNVQAVVSVFLQGGELGCDALQQQVYEQWLLSDLAEVGASCLPSDLLQHARIELPGHYCLQVNVE